MFGKEYLDSPLKKSFDLTFASALLLTTSPIFLSVYLYNLRRKQPMLFRQQRVGKDGVLFLMNKFETMYAGAELKSDHLDQIHANKNTRGKYDTRIQPGFLAKIRRYSLNELPQLLNILVGNMSFIGPRPLLPEYIAEAEQLFPDMMSEWRETACKITPGLIGVAPLITRNLPVQEFDIVARADINYYYNASLGKDIFIMFQALKAIVQ